MVDKTIFYGVTVKHLRDIVAQKILEQNPQKIVMPCVGRFTVVENYIRRGGNKEIIETSDISLFSSMIGYLADKTKDFEELQIRMTGDFIPATNDPIDIVATALIQLKYNQIRDNNQYNINYKKEILYNKSYYIKDMKEKLKKLLEIIGGVRYDIKDLWQVIEEVKNDKDYFLFVNPPTYKSSGYANMFPEINISWAKPNIPYFSVEQKEELLDALFNMKGKVMMGVCDTEKGLNKYKKDWKVIVAGVRKKDKNDYFLTNYEDKKVFTSYKTLAKKPKIYPIYNEQEITRKSKIGFVPVKEETALYYRDLFIHRLGVTKAEAYYLLLVDGRVIASCGFMLGALFRGKSEYIFETFGVCINSQRYKKLMRLQQMAVTCGQFKKLLLSDYNFGVRDIKGYQMVHLSEHEYYKGTGILTLIKKEKQKSGWKLTFCGDFREDTYKQTLARWLQLSETRWAKEKDNGGEDN